MQVRNSMFIVAKHRKLNIVSIARTTYLAMSKSGNHSSGSAPRVAIVGCGHWGKNLIRNFSQIGHLAAVSDISNELATVYSADYGVPARSFDDILKDNSIDGIVIAAPAAVHAKLTRDALGAGKHVFVEKPMSLDVEEAEELAKLARSSDRILMVGHLLQYHPAFRKLQNIIAEGWLGKLQYIYSNRLSFGKIRKEENILWSFAPHDISMILELAGEVPESVDASGSNFILPDIADVTTTQLRFPSGLNAHIFVSWLHPFKEHRLVVIGDRGMAEFNDGMPFETKLQYYPHDITWKEGTPELSPANAIPVPCDKVEPLNEECRHFVECILNRRTPRTDADEGVRVLRVLARAQECLDMQKETGPNKVERPMATNIHPTAVIDNGCQIGQGTRIWHFSHVLSRSVIGKNCVIGQNVSIGPDVTIGDACKIQNNVSIYKGVTLEDSVFCGPSCVFTNVTTPRAEIDRKSDFKPTLVKHGASIGANATILCGLTIGEYSLVGAGALISKDVPAFAVMTGVPARRSGWASRAGEILGEDLTCPHDGSKYRLTESGELEPDYE